MDQSKKVNVSSSRDTPLITIIIPTFRRPHLLKRAIESVLAQTYPHFQICIYDNCSQDETPGVVAEYISRDKRIKYHVHSKNIGSNNNWQYGFNQVDTPFFVVLSDDDLFMPTFLEEAMKGFVQYPDAGVFIGGLIVIDEKQRVKGYDLYEWARQQYYEPKEFITELVQGRPFPFWAAMVFRKEVRDRTGQLKAHLLWHDVEFLMRTFKEFPVILNNTPCSIFLVHSSNISLGLSIEELVQLRLCFGTMLDDLFSHEEKEMLMKKLGEEAHKSILEFCFQKFARFFFEECLQGTEILIQNHSLNFKGKILRFLSQKSLKNRCLVYLLTPLIYIRRAVVRSVNKGQLKNKISNSDFENFTKLIKR
jgi:glycosyltransferase involved in cell wall biosynthesis